MLKNNLGRGKFGIAPKEARTFEGEVFDSKAELHRWLELKLLERAGQVSDLTRQVKFVLIEAFTYRGKKIRETAYFADFVYKQNGNLIAEDLKGVCTKEYQIKKKLFLKIYGEKYLFFENKLSLK